jgi:hypothetical protein
MKHLDAALEQVAAADGAPATMAAAQAAFELLLATCHEYQERHDELFAAFAFAAAAAADGATLLCLAPSLPPRPAVLQPAEPLTAPSELVASTLGGMARVLSDQLYAASRRPGDRVARDACRDGAREAARIYGLLLSQEVKWLPQSSGT